VAKIASNIKSSNVCVGIFFNPSTLPLNNIQSIKTTEVKRVLIERPSSGFISFSPIFAKRGDIPQQTIPIKARK
jgi:hypothetical protein